MCSMDAEHVFQALSGAEWRGSGAAVTGVEYDSRNVKVGDVFVAMRGESTDGNRYIDAALSKGAAAIITDSREAYERLAVEHAEVPTALVERGRRALAEASVVVLGHPERKLALTGVTGTN